MLLSEIINKNQHCEAFINLKLELCNLVKYTDLSIYLHIHFGTSCFLFAHPHLSLLRGVQVRVKRIVHSCAPIIHYFFNAGGHLEFESVKDFLMEPPIPIFCPSVRIFSAKLSSGIGIT